MWLDRALESRTATALALSAQYAEQRHQVLVENAANIDTPGYQTRRLDAGEFQGALRDALQRSREKSSAGLELRSSAQVTTDRAGRLAVHPVEQPAQNVLFHDGSNARLETLLGEVQKNALGYNMSLSMLKGKFERLLAAIRGRNG